MTENNSDFNDDELQQPEWLNDEFFLEVLSNCEKSDSALKILTTKLAPASKKGDHYASVMFRATVNYKLDGEYRTKSMIIKTMPEIEGHKKDFMGDSNLFETEIGMYTEVLPRLELMLRDVGDNTVLKADCLYSSLSPRKIIIFEDIVPLGFEVLRDRGVNKEEAKLAYSKLAKLHATTYKIIKEEPHFLDKYRYSVLEIPNITEQEFMSRGIHNFVDFLKETPALQEYAPYFESLSENLLKKCRINFGEFWNLPKEDTYYVLNHGDFHLKNLMFKHNPVSGRLDDVMLLDYQVTYVGPVVHDLMYSQYMLLDKDLRKDFPALLYYYFTVFSETLKQIGFKGEMPRILRLHEQFLEYKHYGFLLLTTIFPMFYGFVDPKVNVNELLTSNDLRKTFYNKKIYIDELLELLPKLQHLGYLED